jgi:hypothetical protein
MEKVKELNHTIEAILEKELAQFLQLTPCSSLSLSLKWFQSAKQERKKNVSTAQKWLGNHHYCQNPSKSSFFSFSHFAAFLSVVKTLVAFLLKSFATTAKEKNTQANKQESNTQASKERLRNPRSHHLQE